MFCYTLTISINAYDQFGEYLLVVFKELPSFEELKESLIGGGIGSISNDHYQDLIECGTCSVSHNYLYLTKVEFGKRYQNIQ